MSRTNFKPTDTIIIRNTGSLLDGQVTKIVSINTENDLPIKVDVFGEHYLTLNEVELVIEGKKAARVELSAEKGAKTKAEQKEGLETPKIKRPYVRRGDKPIVEKRKYTKKIKP